jgi:hypothetical protein
MVSCVAYQRHSDRLRAIRAAGTAFRATAFRKLLKTIDHQLVQAFPSLTSHDQRIVSKINR